MITLSRIGQSIHSSPTLKINEKAAQLRAQGESVIHLGGGEPKSCAPFGAIVAASNLLNSGEIRYTPSAGTPALRKAIVDYTQTFYRQEITPKNVIASNGAKQAIMTALLAIIDPGDEVIFPAPYWVSYPEMVSLCGGVSRVVNPESGYIPTIKAFEAAISPKTKAIILNSPNNPSGLTYPESLVSDLVQLCERRDLWLIMDDIYHRLTFDGYPMLSCFDYAQSFDERSKLVVINGISKQYAMTGFRIGWAVASPVLIQAMNNIQSHFSSGPSALLQHAAVAALTGPQSSVESLRLTLQNQRDVLVDLARSIPGLKVEKPHGTFYSFIDFSAYEKSSHKLAEYLINSVRVATVPGLDFGMEGHLRISYCGSMKDIVEGFRRISWALGADGSDEIEIGGKRVRRAECIK